MNLGFYRTPVDLSAAGKHAPLLKNLPRDVGVGWNAALDNLERIFA